MPRIARCAISLAAIAVVTMSCTGAFAGDPSDVPPRELPPQVDRWNRGPAYTNDEDVSRSVPGEPYGAAPRPLPVEASQAERHPAERQVTAQMNAEPESQPNALKLSPLSEQGRAGARTGEVPSLVTGAASLGIVLGLFLLVAFVVRRGMPKNSALLPAEAVEILGRAPLIGRQQVHLLRCGNKILLVYATATGVETLTEIDDPAEVDRLAGICQQNRPQSASASFRQVFQQFDREPPVLDYPARHADDEVDFGHLDSALRRRTQEARG
jgi:flagellar biogenesis protein FliO